jgi:uncharacterized protein YggE
MIDDEKPSFPSIAVMGVGKISARPDFALVEAGVVTQASTAKEAVAANNEAMTRLYAVLKERGVAEKDIRTSQVQISPVYSQPHAVQVGEAPPQTAFVPRVVAYTVENTVRIGSRQIDKVGPLLDAAVQAGANKINGISFRIEHAANLLDEARKRAIADAKHKAELLADEAGMVVGAPWRIEEPGALVSPPAFGHLGDAERALGAAPSMPIAQGEQELTFTISIIYELKNPK